MPELSRRHVVGLGALGLVAAACGERTTTTPGSRSSAGGSDASPAAQGATPGSSTAPAVGGGPDVRVAAPRSVQGALFSDDVLVFGQSTLDRSTVAAIKRLEGVVGAEVMSMGSFYVDEQEVTYAAVDPATFWRYTNPGTAQTLAVWKRVAAGEIAVEPAVGKALQRKDGFLRLGNERAARSIHVGAYAQLLNDSVARRIDAVVNQKWAGPLGMKRDNALLIAMGSASPQSIRKQLQSLVGGKASVQILGPDLDIKATQTAFLTGGSVARAVGSFSYTANPDGTVRPDPRWVAANIRTETMPIIGSVTGHRVMLPQLRSALGEVVTRGLSSKIYHFDGCYVPRFIARDPSKGLSFHTYGTAVDLNASDNQRGTVGRMDRAVVAIFEKWGFDWGGTWHYTDPMHFELAKLVSAR
ncbi:MAG: D-alanyl-D-alanine carboxypeptidase [Marmoricola sp.]|nr:D-alanyl-D-alanine carboxypeptidase [Marmoricola sp.]